MSKHVRALLLVTTVLVVALGVPALAHAKGASVTRPKLSAQPIAGIPFNASVVVRPKATLRSRTVVKLGLYAFTDGRWVVRKLSRAKLVAGSSGAKYSRQLTVATEGKYRVRAFHYRAGKLVAKSALAAFDVARRVTIDSNVNGWLAPELGESRAPSGAPLDVVFTTPAGWAAALAERKPLEGAPHFIWGGFEKVDTKGLIWHTDGLQPGRYDWMRDGMPESGTGCLVVAQRIDIDDVWSHEDTHALAHLPADISFGNVTGCASSIAFVTGDFSKTSVKPLVWHTDGLVPGSYDWKCYMDGCHYGKLVVEDAPDVQIPASPRDAQISVAPPGAPMDLVFSAAGGMEMSCWRTIHFTTAGSDLTKTTSFTPTDPHLTWHTDGLARGAYEWECWMGPQCHHGTVVVE